MIIMKKVSNKLQNKHLKCLKWMILYVNNI